MKLLFFSHSSWLNGAERSLVELVKELTNDYGAECTVVLPSKGPLEKMLENVGAKIIIGTFMWWCSFEEIINDREKKESYFQSLTWLDENLDMLRNLNPDVVLTNTLVIPWGAVVASLLRRPHVWMVNEFGELDLNLKFFFPFQQILDIINSSSDKIVTRSKAIQNQLFPNNINSKVSTIYRYIELPQIDENSTESNENFFQLSDAFHVIIAGTILKGKGQEDAVRSVIELVKNRHRQVELLVVGNSNDPTYQQSLFDLIKVENAGEYIHIIPHKDDVLSIIKSADIVMVCSRMEGLGRVVLEAMLMGKTVIGTNKGGIIEMITDEETGLLYSPGDYVKLADQVERLMDNNGLRLKIAENGLNFARQNFSKEKFGGEYYKILMDLKKNEYLPKDNLSSYINFYFQAFQSQKEISIQNLKAKITECDQFYSQSKSWKITRPLRWLSQLFKRKGDANP